MSEVTVVIQGDMSEINLLNQEEISICQKLIPTRMLAVELLPSIEIFKSNCDMDQCEIERITHVITSADTSITARAVRTVANVWTFAHKTFKNS